MTQSESITSTLAEDQGDFFPGQTILGLLINCWRTRTVIFSSISFSHQVRGAEKSKYAMQKSQ